MPDPQKKTVSATQVPALFACSPYETMFSLYHWFKGDIPETETDSRMSWGSKMQPLLTDQAAEDLALEVTPNPEDTYIAGQFVGCTRDADIYDPSRGWGALEIKCVFDYRTWMDRWGGGKPPKDIELQLQTQMLVGKDGKSFDWGVIGVWIGGEMKYYERKANNDLWKAIQGRAASFLAQVEDGPAPDPFGTQRELPIINQLWPSPAPAKVLTIESDTEDLEEDARMYRWATAQKAYFTKLEGQLKAKLTGLAQDNGTVLFPQGTKMYVSKSETAEKVITADEVGKVSRKASVRTSVKVQEPDTERA